MGNYSTSLGGQRGDSSFHQFSQSFAESQQWGQDHEVTVLKLSERYKISVGPSGKPYAQLVHRNSNGTTYSPLRLEGLPEFIPGHDSPGQINRVRSILSNDTYFQLDDCRTTLRAHVRARGGAPETSPKAPKEMLETLKKEGITVHVMGVDAAQVHAVQSQMSGLVTDKPNAHFLVLLVDNDFLRAEQPMLAMTEWMHDRNIKHRILPVRAGELSIFGIGQERPFQDHWSGKPMIADQIVPLLKLLRAGIMPDLDTLKSADFKLLFNEMLNRRASVIQAKPTQVAGKTPHLHFTGREQELTKMTHELERGNAFTLTGPRGIGKSELALRFANHPSATKSQVSTSLHKTASINPPAIHPVSEKRSDSDSFYTLSISKLVT